MFKPSDINPSASPSLRLDRLEVIAQQFDKAIKSAEKTGQWPAAVPSMRDDATHEEIAHMIEQYREAGWIISAGAPRGDWRATIDHPARHGNK